MMSRIFLAALPLATLLFLAPAPPQDAPASGAVPNADRGDGFFKPAWHAGRRKALVELLRNRKPSKKAEGAEAGADEKKGVIVLRGAPGRRDYQRFRQTNEFFYLTGVEAPGAALVIGVADGKETLFLASPAGAEGIFDDIRPHAKPKPESAPADGSARPRRRANADVGEQGWVLAQTLGFDDIREGSELDGVLASMKDAGPFFAPFAPEEYEATSRDDAERFELKQARDSFDGRTSRTMQFREKLKERYGVTVKDLTPYLDALRDIKTPEEIEAMRRASQIAAAGHIAAMRATKPGLKEWQIGAEATAVFYRMGAPAVSYFPIVGTGRNALILHYTDIGATVKADDVVLMDYAPEWHYYASDVTRSWPANGKFSADGKKIYEAVLKSQEAAIAKVKPGASFGDVYKASLDALREAGFDPDVYMWHGLSHSIGMTTHDVGNFDVLKPGHVFTIEPGVYDKKTGIGVRIEDVIAVTATGVDVLSAGAPKTVAAIEAIVGKTEAAR